MRTVRRAFLGTAMTLLLCGCAGKTPPADSSAAADAPADFPTMTLTRNDASDNADYTLILQNDTGIDWYCGSDYRLYDPDTRQQIPFREGIAWNAMAYSVSAHSNKEIPVYLSSCFDDLPEGDYLFQKELFVQKSKELTYKLLIEQTVHLP